MSDAVNDMVATDSRGRTLKLRVIDPGEMMDLMEAAGGASGNQAWMQYAIIVASVEFVDGVPMPIAITKDAVKANARMIGHDGIAAATAKLYGDAPKPEDRAAKIAEEIATAKN